MMRPMVLCEQCGGKEWCVSTYSYGRFIFTCRICWRVLISDEVEANVSIVETTSSLDKSK